MGFRVGVPGSDEDVVNSAAMVRLTNDRRHLRASVGVVNIPGVTRSISTHGPGVVIVNAPTANGLKTGEVPDTGCFRSCIEVAGDDRRKGASVRASRSAKATACRSRADSASRRHEVEAEMNRSSPSLGWGPRRPSWPMVRPLHREVEDRSLRRHDAAIEWRLHFLRSDRSTAEPTSRRRVGECREVPYHREVLRAGCTRSLKNLLKGDQIWGDPSQLAIEKTIRRGSPALFHTLMARTVKFINNLRW